MDAKDFSPASQRPAKRENVARHSSQGKDYWADLRVVKELTLRAVIVVGMTLSISWKLHVCAATSTLRVDLLDLVEILLDFAHRRFQQFSCLLEVGCEYGEMDVAEEDTDFINEIQKKQVFQFSA